MKIIQSQFHNTCGLCGDRIEIGQNISPMQKRWYHTECAEGAQRPPPRPQPTLVERDDLALAREQYHRYKQPTFRIIPTAHPVRTPLSGDRDLLADVGALLPLEKLNQLDKPREG